MWSMAGILDKVEKDNSEKIAERLIRGGELSDVDIADACEIDIADVQKLRKRVKEEEEEKKDTVTV